jgi:uncharacterized protein YneF (UPF0154 family)
MLKYILSRKLIERGLYGIVLCVLSFLGGQFILNKISTMEDPPFGNTIYILIGNLFVFGSLLGFFILLKYMYDENKKEKRKVNKRKSHKIYYLNKKDNESYENDIEK